ncbi:hypothetical protein [Burkholderia thailandensis]|uniref:hypothetical protein n=1 Tax=Burkholderia thailandensis TaxID=57975 RepID=UPI00299005F8|nr:hypothetical protein [Burkholderia thailandensis]
MDNASELVEHLLEMRKSVNPTHGTFLAEDRLSELTDISDAAAALERVKQNFHGTHGLMLIRGFVGDQPMWEPWSTSFNLDALLSCLMDYTGWSILRK